MYCIACLLISVLSILFSVHIAYNHNKDPNQSGDWKSPLSIVTATVDRISEYNVMIEPEVSKL